ncbi:Putative N-acetylmannosaminyltransferase [Polystyrenella longa]|uniref:N-acetylmannosaminyltransferase n=1 Tax=Polystyrenella longa TaxID=2528007 RepID=A0A518CQ18_9PLAN|nr:WecB/TagA/CpsF family glycosyltransferase [Polystyrenella longa]QDU81315.1 Putative N-acetylmannosaminyltransferase [Polystyrenella longa]
MIATHETDRKVNILGVDIDDVTVARGIQIVEEMIRQPGDTPSSIYFVNAHTLNFAHSDPEFGALLNRGDRVFGDGTGVRWGARLQGIQIRDNLVGTDFIPSLFTLTPSKKYSYFLMGSDPETVQKAAEYAERMFPGWKQAGYHHGFLKEEETRQAAIDQINACEPDIVLVGMGNPLQEKWIEQYKDQLHTKVCLGIGGLYDYWADNVSRAPLWVRRAGYEWVWRILQQPGDKFKRYLIGNPLYLMNIYREQRQRKRSQPQHETSQI